MKTLIQIVKTSALAVVVAACGASARADDPSESAVYRTRSVTVEYADLNLLHPAGIDSLYSRLRVAAGGVCEPRPNIVDLHSRRDWKQCFETALDNAVSSLDNAALAQVHFLETGRQVYPDERIARSN
jgi:UrcA family protein